MKKKALCFSLFAIAACGTTTPQTTDPVVAPADTTQPATDDPALPFNQRLGIVQNDPQRLNELVGSVQLATNYPDGVPYRAATGALQPIEARATFADGTPVHGAGVTLVDASGARVGEPAHTDDRGIALLTLPAGMQPGAGVRVQLETPTGATGAAVVPVTLRAVTLANARLAVKLDVTVAETKTADTEAVAAFVSQWKQRGGSEPHALTPELATLLASPKETELIVRDIGAHEPLDVLILGTVHTAFANRMSARSVWHQASGVVQVYDVWTGKLLAEHTRDVQAVGLGDAAASAKAINELMRAVAGDVAADVGALTTGKAISAAF